MPRDYPKRGNDTPKRGDAGYPTRGNSGRLPKKDPDRMPANVCKDCSYYGGDHAPDCPQKK